MKLTKEDYEAYQESMRAQEKVQRMGLEATAVVLEWLKKKTKKRKVVEWLKKKIKKTKKGE